MHLKRHWRQSAPDDLGRVTRSGPFDACPDARSTREEHRVKLTRCFITTGLSEVEFEGGARRLLQQESIALLAFEGRTGTAAIYEDRLLSFHPDPAVDRALQDAVNTEVRGAM